MSSVRKDSRSAGWLRLTAEITLAGQKRKGRALSLDASSSERGKEELSRWTLQAQKEGRRSSLADAASSERGKEELSR